MYAARQDDTDSVKALLEHKADANTKDKVRSACVCSVIFGCLLDGIMRN